MNDLFFKFIEKLGSIDNTLLFAASIIPYAIFLFYLYKIKSVNNFVTISKLNQKNKLYFLYVEILYITKMVNIHSITDEM